MRCISLAALWQRPLDFPGGSDGKESACNAGDLGLIPGLGIFPGEGKGNPLQYSWGSLVAQTVKNLPAAQETRIQSWVGKIPWRREWQPTPVFWPGEFHGQRSLGGYSPRHQKESDKTDFHEASYFPDQGSYPHPLHCKVTH